jgi:hypothetical protein
MSRRFIQITLAALAVTLLPAALPALAADAPGSTSNSGLTVSPLTLEVTVKPGEQLRREVKVDNVTDRTLSLQAAPRNFIASGETGHPQITDENTPYSLASWVTITPVQFTLAPKSSTKVTYVINVPVNAEPGGHFGSITVKTVPSQESGSVAIVQEVGSLVLLRVPGDIKESADIESFKATPGFSEKGPIDLELRLKNTGNVHFRPNSTVTITNLFGHKVAELKYEQGNVLPQSVRRFDTTWRPAGLWGKYAATVTVVYGEHNQVLQQTTHFWGAPYKLTLGLLILLLILILLIYLNRRRFQRGIRAFMHKD